MVQGDKNTDGVGTPTDESEEIDRIMREIEDLEKKMDSPPEQEQAAATAAPKPSVTAAAPVPPPPPEEEFAQAPQTSKVVPLRPADHDVDAFSMAETDAVPVRDEPLVRAQSENAGNNGLALKVGGCTEVSLEFSRSGITVSLSCSDEGLCITTDQGAEFRIPFKRAA